MRVAILLFGLVLTNTTMVRAEQNSPIDQFAGQIWNETVCDPTGSTRTMSVCYALWRDHEEALLQQSVEQLLAYARDQETRSPLFTGERGFVDSVTRGQTGWLDWRNNECMLATLSSVAGSIRQLTYPGCQASLTALRRERLDELLARWRAEFRSSDGGYRRPECALEPALGLCRDEN